jgi:L-threonylcarbamoyladenylate synthase
VTAEPRPEEPDVSDPRDAEPGGGEPEEGESVELEERDIEADAYARFDCTSDDAAVTTAAVDAARHAVEAGSCIVLPTDTVYGIGADAFSAEAVQGLLDAKNRGRDMPPPVLIGDASLVRALATDVPDEARDLVEVHWPGPLTIVCRIQPSLRMDLGDTDGTIALRVPDHALAREILRRTGPLAVSSANLSGRPAALTCDEAVDQLGDRVAVYLDGGPLGTAADGAARTALPSTIVDFTRHDDGQILRRGALDLETLRRVLPGLRDLEEPAPAATQPDEPVAAPRSDEPVTAQPDEPRVEPEPTT